MGVLTNLISTLFNPTGLPVAGIDIGAGSVKVLVLSKNGQGYQVEAWGDAKLSLSAVIEKEIKEPQMVASALREAVSATNTAVKEAAVALADSSVITRLLAIDKNTPEIEMEAQVLLDAERYIPYPINEVRFDYEIVGQSTQGDSKHPLDVLFAASRIETVDSYVQTLALAGLNAKIVDVESYATLRAYQLLVEQQRDLQRDTTAIVNIGAKNTVLTVIHKDNPIFTQSAAFGDERLISDLAKHYQLSEEGSRKMIIERRWPLDALDLILQPFSESLVQQIRRKLQFFASANHSSEVNQIILVGALANLPGLASYVGQAIEVPTIVGDPFSAMRFAPKLNKQAFLAQASAYFICCGLALRGFA
jgi:type IV pilus assembly protein PilM